MRPTIRSAGAVVVRQAAGECRYLLLRAYNYWDFPKGLVKEGERPLAAARREVAEETGITDLEFPWGEGFYETEPYGRGKIARYYLARTCCENLSLPVSQELGRPEHDEYRWLTYQQARTLLVPRVRPALDWAAKTSGCV